MAGKRRPLRLFTAIEIPEDRKDSIELAILPFRRDLPNARWVPRHNWHITVRFIGETQDVGETAEETRQIASSCRQGSMSLADIGAFASVDRARVLWLGISDHDRTAASLAGRGDYQPHVTLARLKDASLRDLVSSHAPLELDRHPFEVRELVLFQSHLGRQGSTYEVVQRFPLAAP